MTDRPTTMPKTLALGLVSLCLFAVDPLRADETAPGAKPPAGDVRAQWQARAARLRADPSVVRFYTFQEGTGDIVANAAGKSDGDMLLVGYSPYGLYQGLPRWPAPAPVECPRWTSGRWPGKAALACGATASQLVRSQFHGVTTGAFTIECWVRPHPVDEEEWAAGDILALGGGWGAGWRLYGERQHWCRQGWAGIRLGVPAGVTCTPYKDSVPFAFGLWHYLAAVWDGKEIRLHVDGNVVAAPVTGPNPLPALAAWELENDFGGLKVGGQLRFDIDELVIYDRALSAAELADNYAAFRPLETAKPVPSKLADTVFALPLQSGGYFPVGKPVEATIRVPQSPGDYVVKCIVRPRGGGAVVFEREEKPAAGAVASFAFTPERCGLFDVEFAIRDAAGAEQRKRFPIGVVLAATGDAGLGVRHDVAVQPWAKALGIGWGRVVVDWGQIEPEKEVYNWVLADQLLETATASGLKTVCCVTGWPAWLALDAPGKRRPANLKRYQDFLELLASRYRKEIVAWEIWDAPFGAPRFHFREGKDDYAAVTAAAAVALRQPFVNQGGLRLERCGFRQPAAPMGRLDPADFGSSHYAKQLRGTVEEGQWIDIWPWPLYPAQRSAVLQVWKVLAFRAAGANVVALDCLPDQFYPSWNNSDGTPSGQGVAIAALAATLAGAEAIQALPAAEGLNLIRIVRPAAGTVTVVGARRQAGLKIRLPAGLKVCDWQGNPLDTGAAVLQLGESPLYVVAALEPGQVEIVK